MPPTEDPTNPVTQPASRESSLFAVLRRRASIIVIVTLLCGAAAAVFAYANRDSYESTAKLLFRQTVSPGLTGIGFPVGAPDADNLAANNVELVDSRRVAVATSRDLGRAGVELSPDEVEDDVFVGGAKDSEVVNVTAQGDSAGRAQLLAGTYAQAAADLAEADDRAQAARVLTSVDQQLAELPRRERDGPAGRRLQENRERLRALIAAGTGSPQIIQPAYLPTSESGNVLQTILLGLLFGVVLGVALALLRDQSDGRLHRAEDVSGAFEAPVVTTVPRHRKLKQNARFEDLPPEVAEAFRMLQVNLRYGRDRGGAYRARDLVAQPRGQDHGRLEPGVGRGLERPLGRARGGRHAASRAGRALRAGARTRARRRAPGRGRHVRRPAAGLFRCERQRRTTAVPAAGFR